MSKSDARPLGLLVALAACCWLAGCAGSGERLPECKGRAVPINSLVAAVSAIVPQGSAADAR
jgi:hypothetical protein